MKQAGYGPDKRLKVKVSTRNIATFRDPAVILLDQLKQIYIDSELEVIDTSVYYNRVFKKDYVVALNLIRQRRRRSRCHLLRGLCLRLTAQLQRLLRPRDDQAVRGPVARARPARSACEMVWDIDAKLQEDIARPIISNGQVRQAAGSPTSRASRSLVNSIYNGWRYEDVWLER